MTRRRICQFAASLVIVAISAAGPALAETLNVPIDHSVRLGVAGQASSVLVGNPAIADVTVVDSHTVYVLGRGYGQTDVVILDRAGQPIYSSEVTVGASGSGRVSLYRGASRTDLACAPGCQVSVRSPGADPSGGSSSATAAPASGAASAVAPAAN